MEQFRAIIEFGAMNDNGKRSGRAITPWFTDEDDAKEEAERYIREEQPDGMILPIEQRRIPGGE